MSEPVDATRYGANGALVEQLLAEAATPLAPGEADAQRQRLLAAVCSVPGDADSPGMRARQRVDRLVAEARELDWRATAEISGALQARFGGDLAVHVPEGEPRDGARRLLLAAFLWPAVHGAQPNPFEAAIGMARGGTFAEVGIHRVHQWHRGIEVPADLGCAAPQKPPDLIVSFG